MSQATPPRTMDIQACAFAKAITSASEGLPVVLLEPNGTRYEAIAHRDISQGEWLWVVPSARATPQRDISHPR